ncbi:MAG: BON domain-containing protein [Planctomycetaceae bacterium]
MMMLDQASTKARAKSPAKQLQHEDELLALQIERALRGVGCHPLRELKVTSDNGRVTLSGVVPTYYLKQIAQCVTMRFDDVTSVDNQLMVR